MSDQKTYTGEIRNTGLTLKDFASANGYDGEDLDDWLYDNYNDEYEVVNGIVYELILRKSEGYDVFHAVESSDGYYVALSYYSGGISMADAIEQAIKNAE